MSSPTPAPTSNEAISLSQAIGQAFIPLAAVVLLGYGFFKVLEALVDNIQSQLQYVKWIDDKKEPFRSKHGYGHEWVFACPVYDTRAKLTPFQKKYSHKGIVSRLAAAGFETRMHFNLQRDVVFIKVRASMDCLKRFADIIDYKVELNPVKLKSRLETGMKNEAGEWTWLPVNLVDPLKMCKFEHTQHIFGKYDQSSSLQDLFKQADGSIFKNIDRLKLMMAKMESSEDSEGCNLPLRRLVKEKAVLATFPLHEYRTLLELKKKWLVLFAHPEEQPFDEIRNYFGEKIALYFVWLGMYTKWLVYATVLGGLCWLDVALEGGNYSAPGVVVFALFMGVWSTLFLEAWKNEQARRALAWGMIGYEDEELERVDFGNHPGVIKIPNPVGSRYYLPELGGEKAGKVEADYHFFPSTTKALLVVQSQIVIGVMVIVVMLIVAVIFAMKVAFFDGVHEGVCDFKPDSMCTKVTVPPGHSFLSNMNFGSSIVGLLNAVAIQLLAVVFNEIARRLNDRENHRTETDYEDSLIVKSFAFSFINSYASLFFTAFVVLSFPDHRRTQFCPEDNCMAALSTALTTLFMVRLTSGNIMEVLVPFLQQRRRIRETEAESKISLSSEEQWMLEPMTAVEEQFMMEHYDMLLDMFGDYLEMVVQFGYATLFSAAFLFAPLLGLINNYVEIRVDAWKISSLCQRPFPKAAEDIGSWQMVMEIMNGAAVITNVALICFTSSLLDGMSFVGKLVVFTFMEHLIMGFKLFLAFIIPDVPEDVEIQKQRTQAYVNRVILCKEDDALLIQEYETEHGQTLSRGRNKFGRDLTPADFDVHVSDHEYVKVGQSRECRKKKTAEALGFSTEAFRSTLQQRASQALGEQTTHGIEIGTFALEKDEVEDDA